jgi:TPR repeat protein
MASDQGNASATYNLAVFYAHGIGGLKTDRGKALKLLESAVALGEPNAKQLLERYVFNKTRMSMKKENESKKEDELKTNVQDKSCKEEAWITQVRSNFAALKLPFGAGNALGFPAIKTKFGRNTTPSSVSTDDGLASEYESSNPSVESSSGTLKLRAVSSL